jgi:FkbM family methyltransferase
VLLPWRVRWTLAQFAQSGEYRKHSEVLRSPPAFYLTTLEKLIPGLSSREKHLALTDGHVIPVRDFMTLYIYKEVFVDRCYDLKLDRSNPVIIDIGANSGLFALRIKQLYPSAQISCYEPYPPNFEQLENTIALNGLESVTPLRKAVGAQPGQARLFIHKRNMGGHSLYAAEALGSDCVEVEVVNLASILDELRHDVDLLKIDCEGSEFDILMNLTSREARKIRQIIVETTSGLYDVDQLSAQMASLGYRHQTRKGLSVYTLDS